MGELPRSDGRSQQLQGGEMMNAQEQYLDSLAHRLVVALKAIEKQAESLCEDKDSIQLFVLRVQRDAISNQIDKVAVLLGNIKKLGGQS